MKTNQEVIVILLAAYCLTCISAGTQLPTYLSNQNIIQNLTSSYSALLDDIYNYLGAAQNISEKCRLDMNTILHLANSGDKNALKILDASGKPSSGILEGGVYFIGFYSECVNTVVRTDKTRVVKGKYCLLNFNVSTSVHQEILPVASWQVLSTSTKPPTIGLCIPLSCSDDDVKFATDASLYDNFEDVEGRIATCHTNPGGFSKDTSAIFFMCFQLVVLLTVSIATAYDYYIQWKKNKAYVGAASVSTELLCDQTANSNDPGLSMRYLLAFSIYTNAPKIFSVGARDNISCLHGLRFLSMTLIIFGHSYSFAGSILFLRNPGFASQAPKDFVTQIFANGTFAVDTFFFMSGLLVCYAGIKTLEMAKKKITWLAVFYVHRYIRLTPLMMAVIFNCAFLLRYISSGPDWLGSIMMYDDWCRKQWWVNALYIHNFYGTEKMCLSHTWYLATDFQMYFVAPFVLIPLVWNYKAGIAAMGAFLVATTIATGVLTAEHHYPAIPYINNVVPLELVNAYYKNVYIKPYCRMGPFIVGMAIGYFLYKKKDCILNKYVIATCWILSVGTGLSIIYLMWPANQGILPSNAEAAAYSALARTAWGLCLAWLVFACYYGYGGFINSILSWPVWVPFSRLTFPAYLIHPVIISAVYGSTEGTREFSYSYMLYMFIGHMVITYTIALVLSLVYESPFVVMEKLVLHPPKKAPDETSKKSMEDLSHKL